MVGIDTLGYALGVIAVVVLIGLAYAHGCATGYKEAMRDMGRDE